MSSEYEAYLADDLEEVREENRDWWRRFGKRKSEEGKEGSLDLRELGGVEGLSQELRVMIKVNFF